MTTMHFALILSLFLHSVVPAPEPSRPASDFNMRHLGYTLSTLKYYQMGVDIDVKGITRNIQMLSGLINNTRTLFNMDKFYQVNNRAICDLRQKVDATWQLGTPLSGGLRDGQDDDNEPLRTARNPMAAFQWGLAIAGAIGGLYKNYQLRQLKKQIRKQETQLNSLTKMVSDHDSRLSEHGEKLGALERWVNLTTEQIFTLDQSLQTQTFIDGHIREIASQAADAAIIVEGLLSGRLSHRAIQPEAMTTMLQAMSSEAAAAGHTLLVKTSGEAFQSKASYLATKTGFFAILHLPMATTEDLMDLWLFIAVPLQISLTRHMTVHPGFDVIAMSQDKSFFKTMTLADLTVCDKRGLYHFCAAANLHTKVSIARTYQGQRNDQLCALFIYEGQFDKVRTACSFHLDKPTDQGFVLSGTEVVFVSTSTQQGTSKCPNRIESTFQVSGVTAVSVPVGCTVRTDFFSATGTSDENQDEVIRRQSKWPTALPPPWADLNLALLDVLESEGATDVPVDAAKLRLYLDEATIHRRATKSHIALWSMVGIIFMLGAGLIFWAWRVKEVLRRKMRSLLMQGMERVFAALEDLGLPRAAAALRAKIQPLLAAPPATAAPDEE